MEVTQEIKIDSVMFFIKGEKRSVAKNRLGLTGHSFSDHSFQDKVVAIYNALDED